MDRETFERHKAFAGETKPSMLRRRVGHDYGSRCVYLVTLTTEGRLPLLGQLTGDALASPGTAEVPRVELTELGMRVSQCWQDVPKHYPTVKVLATMLMPDHLHGILFLQEAGACTLSEVIRGFKAGTNKALRQLFPEKAASLSSYAATVLQQRETALQQSQRECKGRDDRNQGYLWSRGFNDHILENGGELDRWFTYLQDNPRRLAMKRAYPDLFRVRFNITIGNQAYAAIGNRFLLTHPEKWQVQCSRRLTDEDIETVKTHVMAAARRGAIPVSPAISKGEQAVMRAVLDARLPLIFLTPWGFNEFSKPGHQYYEACAEGRFLILAPWPHQNRQLPLTRNMCLQLNAMAASICATAAVTGL